MGPDGVAEVGDGRIVQRRIPVAIPKPSFNFEDVQTLAVTLKNVDPSLRRTLYRELQQNAKPFLTEMNTAMDRAFIKIPSGMISHQGRTQYNRPVARASSSLGGRRNTIFLVRVQSPDSNTSEAGFMIAELAGTKDKYQRTTKAGNPDQRGPHFNEILQEKLPLVGPGKGGRIAFRAFLRVQPTLRATTDTIIQRWILATNKDLKKGRVPQ